MSDTHIYMRLPALSGESTAAGHVEDIELESISWGMRVKTEGAAIELDGFCEIRYAYRDHRDL